MWFKFQWICGLLCWFVPSSLSGSDMCEVGFVGNDALYAVCRLRPTLAKPTLAKPTLANFTVSVFSCFQKKKKDRTTKQHGRTSTLLGPEGRGPEGWATNLEKVGPGRVGPRRVGPRRVGPEPRKGGAPKGGASKGGGPKISRFFFPLPPPFRSLVEFWWCFEAQVP